jgi:hypothetical protein
MNYKYVLNHTYTLQNNGHMLSLVYLVTKFTIKTTYDLRNIEFKLVLSLKLNKN